MRISIGAALVAGFVAAPASAQFVVFDPANTAKAISIVQQMYSQYEQSVRQYNQLLAISQRLPGMDAYRMTPLGMVRHSPWRAPYAAPFLDALNSGDEDGARFNAVVQPRPTFTGLSPAAMSSMTRQGAGLEITDSILQRGLHQIGSLRGFSGALQAAIQLLTDHVTSAKDTYHSPTAVLDKISGGEVIARQQDQAQNQYLSHQLEIVLDQGKRNRDAEAEVVNMWVTGMAQGREAQRGLVAGSGDALRTWRQP